MKKFYKTTLVIEVFTEDEPLDVEARDRIFYKALDGYETTCQITEEEILKEDYIAALITNGHEEEDLEF